MFFVFVLLCTSFILLWTCLEARTNPPVIPRKEFNNKLYSGKGRLKEAWNAANNPDLWGTVLSERRLPSLPRSGQASKIPWSGSYWPTYGDSINAVWDIYDKNNNMSPAAKYAKVFNDPNLMDRVSAVYGVDSQKTSKVCTSRTECNPLLSETCAIRAGQTKGRCIPTWYGICHAWSPAAIDVDEPRHSVFYRGVHFKINDLKALLSLTHDVGSGGLFLSLRCNDQRAEFEYDEFGRINDPSNNFACRDSNAGTFHIVITNMLGIHHKSFIEDRTIDYQVWNQPVRSFSSTWDYVSVSVVLQELGVDYVPNPLAIKFAKVTTRLYFIGEPQIWINGYFNQCQEKTPCAEFCPGWAKTLNECNQTNTCIDSFTGSDLYNYILELDENENIIGGEWIRDSKSYHPDFFWLPTPKKDDVILYESAQFLYSIYSNNHTISSNKILSLRSGSYLEIYIDHGCAATLMDCDGNCLDSSECLAYFQNNRLSSTKCSQLISNGRCDNSSRQFNLNCPMNSCDGRDCKCGAAQDPLAFTSILSKVYVDGNLRCSTKARESCFVEIFNGNENITIITESSAPQNRALLSFASYKGGISYAAVRMLHEKSIASSCESVVCHDGWIADGYCDPFNNRIECNWDGGDCCQETCISTKHSCRSNGYDCQNPKFTQKQCSDDLTNEKVCEKAAQNNSICFNNPLKTAMQCPVACGICTNCSVSQNCSCPSSNCEKTVKSFDKVTGCPVCSCECESSSVSSKSEQSKVPVIVGSVFGTIAAVAFIGCFVRRIRRKSIFVATAVVVPAEPQME